MTNRTLVLFIALALLAAVVGLAIDSSATASNSGELLLNYGLGFGQLAGLYLLLRNGTLMRSVYFRIIQFLVGLAIIGVLFKVEHWVGGTELLLASLLGIALTYAVRFANKLQKSWLDALKLTWVLVAYGGGALLTQQWVGREIAYVAQALLWLAVGNFIVTGVRNKTLYQNEEAGD